MKKAMSMMEIIFVIVIIGILAGVAIPKLFAGRDDAQILKLKETLALIRSGIEQYKQNSLYTDGTSKYPEGLCLDAKRDKGTTCQNNMKNSNSFFAAVLKNPVTFGSKQGSWDGWTNSVVNETFIYYADNNKNGYVFEYDKNKGTFKCLNSYPGAKVLPCKKLGE
ncbi:prepilin-type N-terminal cleavage/methylation domain-containing protein [Campylobacter sp. RM12647]|uniref:prepilin-type N-terminal cleavage/methylation domain-containing protein n=1 Tax=Campylobacter sp. RM12647 TaxID=2735737 RepID=UPI001DFE5D56|nr:prepilin-type N-terminal cleavage/methylation domain-containing protein [Campylobacter sp. RM12647]